jgi:hypothetical protein
MNDFIKEKRKNSQVFQNMCWRCPTVSSQCAGSLEVLWMLLHYESIQVPQSFSGILSFDTLDRFWA